MDRNSIVKLVSIFPGVHLRELQRLLGVSFSTTRYHVSELTSSGKLISYHEGGFVRLYPVGTTDEDRAIYSKLRSQSSRMILSALSVNENGLSFKGICELTGLSKSTVSEQLSDLTSMGLVMILRSLDDRNVFRVGQLNRLVHLLLQERKISRIEGVTEKFVDLWDF